VLNDSSYRSNVRKLQQAIAESNGLARAADLVEQSFGLKENRAP
jgi:UDP:flavonoid glycosyltransferase YjiC (YdhE family)